MQPILDVFRALEQAMGAKRPGLAMIFMVIALIVSWFIYVPIHELLHAWGCHITGGRVSELQMDAKYGATLLKPYFPFIVVGGSYAGRLTGFDTHGSDWIYFVTVFMPFVLTVLPGVALILLCGRRGRPLLLGTAVVVGLAPFYQLTGDYFEMGSILVTKFVTVLFGSASIGPLRFDIVRSDDIFRLIGELFSKARELGINNVGYALVTTLLVLLSLITSILLAFVTYWMGRLVATPLASIRKQA